MEFYMAPAEGLTGYIYRNAYRACSRLMNRYFTPSVSPRAQGETKDGLSSQEINDILPEHNRGLCMIPQVLTDRAEDPLRVALILKKYGCREVNLNLGCLSPAMVSKSKGAEFLSIPHALDMFLETVTRELDKMRVEISVKARLGIYSSDEFYHLLEIYNKYPLTQLIIHSRVHTDHYKNIPDRKVFSYGLRHDSNPVCYNRDLFTAEDFRGLTQQYSKPGYVMVGRGIVASPSLVEAIETGAPLDRIRLEEFHQRIYEGYRGIISGDGDMLFKMKEIWVSMIRIFFDDGKYGKKIKKTQRLGECEAAVSQVFRDLDIVEGAGFKLY